MRAVAAISTNGSSHWALICCLLAAALILAPAVRRRWEIPSRGESSKDRPSGRTLPAPVLPVMLGISIGLIVGGLSGAVVGLCASGIALALLRRARRSAALEQHPTLSDLDAALTVAASLLRAGSPPEQAIADAVSVFPIPSGEVFHRLARLVAMGHPAHRAWQEVARHDAFRPVASAAIRSRSSGAGIADAWTALAAQARAERDTRTEVRASRAGIAVLAPLGLCFLPAFVCIGVVPMVIGLAGDIFQ